MTRQELLAISKPILFNTEMVQAILDNRKTVTRRAIKPHYRDDEYGFQVITNAHTGEFIRIEKTDENECGIFPDGTERILNLPYQVGDILYVRETWAINYGGFNYFASLPQRMAEQYKWRPSIHMPKEAARIFLRVTAVNVERLQDITEEQAIKEGCIGLDPYTFQNSSYYDKVTPNNYWIATFAGLWDSTIKKSDLDKYGWNANPWVGAYEFERVEVE